MKALAWLAVFSIAGTLANAQSLGEAAERERLRREKLKKAGTETKVIDGEALAAGPAKGSKGTYNTSPVSGTAGAPDASASPPLSTSSRPGETGKPSDVDLIRAEARQRLAGSYQRIGGMLSAFTQAAQQYEGCQGLEVYATNRCAKVVQTMENLIRSVAILMDQAEDAARQGWLNPEEVRAIRKRYGLDDPIWDEIVSYVRRHRR